MPGERQGLTGGLDHCTWNNMVQDKNVANGAMEILYVSQLLSLKINSGIYLIMCALYVQMIIYLINKTCPVCCHCYCHSHKINQQSGVKNKLSVILTRLMGGCWSLSQSS